MTPSRRYYLKNKELLKTRQRDRRRATGYTKDVARNKVHRDKQKQLIVETMGSCCWWCGFSEVWRALHAHHIDPKTKLKPGTLRLWALGRAKLLAEIKKCALLCANCHAGVEAGIYKCPTANSY